MTGSTPAAEIVKFPKGSLLLGAALALALIVAVSWGFARQYFDLQALVRTELRLRSLVATIVHLDEVLTMSARMSAATGDPLWVERYRHFEPLLDAAIKESNVLAPEAHAAAATAATDAANAKLVAMENDALAAASVGRSDKAAALLFSAEYNAEKQVYAAGMARMTTAISARAEELLSAQRARLAWLAFAIFLLTCGVVAVWARIIHLIRRYVEAVSATRAALNDANEGLERRVSERTRELAAVNQSLITAMSERERIEAELRHAQKLESVGQLAAGIAHEINTPIQFVGDSIAFLREACDGVLLVLARYQQLCSAHGFAHDALRSTIDDVEERIDLPFLIAEIPPALARSAEGLERVATIVRSMREFAHPAQSEMASADINRALKATLTIASSEYRHVADLETSFAELPPIVCHLSELNQAFLNIIVNAAHAIGDVQRERGGRGKLRVTTCCDADHIEVRISDDGGGIPLQVRDRIFDPFFTTKGVGRGTGQGLSIARGIIVGMHAGTLSFESELDVGTTFVVRLPIAHVARDGDERARIAA